MVFPGYYATAAAAEARALDLFILTKAAVQAARLARGRMGTGRDSVRLDPLEGVLHDLLGLASEQVVRSDLYHRLSPLEKLKIQRHGSALPPAP